MTTSCSEGDGSGRVDSTNFGFRHALHAMDTMPYSFAKTVLSLGAQSASKVSAFIRIISNPDQSIA